MLLSISHKLVIITSLLCCDVATAAPTQPIIKTVTEATDVGTRTASVTVPAVIITVIIIIIVLIVVYVVLRRRRQQR